MNNTISMQELFDGRIFEVPDYQRSYSWEAKQVREFLEDIQFMSPNRRHYTGTVVLDPITESDGPTDKFGLSYDRFQIVDGQQRLTTTVLLFKAISEAIADNASGLSDLADGIRQKYIATDRLNGQPLPKVKLNTDTNGFFQGLTVGGAVPMGGPQISAHRRLWAAERQIRDHINQLAREQEDPEAWLVRLLSRVTKQMHFTLYETEDSAEVGIIFEVMNDRGKPLTDLEKVKNFLIYASTRLDQQNDLRHQVNLAWSSVLQTLMGANLESSQAEDLFLRSDWRCRYNPQPRDWKGIDSIKERFELRVTPDKHNRLLDDLTVYTDGLANSCVAYADAVNPNRHDAFLSFTNQPKLVEDVRDWNSRLVRINVLQPIVPILMAVRERWRDDARKYLEILRVLERFSFRVYMLKESRSDAGQARLFRLAHRITHRDIGFKGVNDEIRSEMGFRCSEEEFHRTLGQLNAEARWYDWDGLKYLLYEYETHLAADGKPEKGWDVIRKQDLRESIEHILPQTIRSVEYWETRFTDQQHERYVHDIGNLTLTLSNAHYGNKDFPSKKGSTTDSGISCYANSSLHGERELTRWDDWTPTSIEERGSAILAWARDRWSDKQ